MARGTLKAKVNRSTVNPKWHVVFEDQDIEDQDLYESSFGQIVPPLNATPEPKRREAVTPENAAPPAKSTRTASPKDSKKRKTVSFEESGNDSNGAASKKPSTKSAREERSKRRRAMQEQNERRTATKKLPKNVVQIPMLTGTLFLYKGKNRRAEFVRHV